MARASRRNILTLAAALALSSPALGADEDLVRTTFETYKEAILAADGPAAVEVLTAGTFDYYAGSRDLALYGTEEELRTLPSVDLVQVLTLRHRVPLDELRRMSGKQVVTMVVNEGWVGRNSAGRIDIGEVTVSGDTASAIIVNQGRPTMSAFSFTREDGSWKFDMVKLVEATGEALEMLAKTQGTDVHEFVLRLTEQTSGKPVSPEIWDPPLKRPPDTD